MLPRPDAPATRLPYTTADMAERLAKKKAEQDAASFKAFPGGVTKPFDQNGGASKPSWLSQVGNMAKSLVLTPAGTALDMIPYVANIPGVKGSGAWGYEPEDIGTSNFFQAGGQALEQSTRHLVGDVTAIPGLGKDSPSYTADQIRKYGVAEGLASAGLDYGNLALTVAPFVKPTGMAIGNAINDAKYAAYLRRTKSPFPDVAPPKPGTFIDVDALQGSRLPARIVDSPATPATRLAQAQTEVASQPKFKVVRQTEHNTWNNRAPIGYTLVDANNEIVGIANFRIEDGVPKLDQFFIKPGTPMQQSVRAKNLFASIDKDILNYLGQNNSIGATRYNIDTSISQSAKDLLNKLKTSGYEFNFNADRIPKDVGNEIVSGPSIWNTAVDSLPPNNPLLQTDIELARIQKATPIPTAAELARLQREAARAEMGISIDDIEFPPQSSMSTIAKASEDIANAEIYATEIAVREGRVKPGWDLRTKLNWPEFKKPYYEFIANARATQTAFDSYDHIHPEAWIEIGEAQRNSGFTYDQMPNEMRAIQQYFSNAYGKIQEYLSVKSYDPLLSNENFSLNTQQYALYQGREKVFGEFEELIGNIDRAFRVVPPVTRPFTTYRGVSISNAADPYVIAFYRNLKPGDLIYDPAYSSTSINKTLAEQWAGRPDDVVLIIQIPKGTSVVHPISTWTEGMGEFKYHDNAPNEKELLLDRNSTFRVIRNDGKFIEVELVPSNTSVTNVRTVDKETAKTMSFEDALAKVQDETVRQLITNPTSKPFNPLVKGFNQDLPEGEFFS